MGYGLPEVIAYLEQLLVHQDRLILPEGFYRPDFWVIFVALARQKQIPYTRIELPLSVKGYAGAIGLAKALGAKTDDYPHQRKNQGRNYGCLINLDNPALTDSAVSQINGCIRANVDHPHKRGIMDLCEVVGELLDNVWSHGKSTGYSMAQVYQYDQSKKIVFAVADKGLGFRQEINRQNLGFICATDREAIEWCIQEGHSSKLAPPDPWTQALPDDALHNPYGNNVSTIDMEQNHHQGLGLYKLIELVKRFSGELQLITGNCMLQIENCGDFTYSQLDINWQGVAIVCAFNQLNLCAATEDDHELLNLMDRLRTREVEYDY